MKRLILQASAVFMIFNYALLHASTPCDPEKTKYVFDMIGLPLDPLMTHERLKAKAIQHLEDEIDTFDREAQEVKKSIDQLKAPMGPGSSAHWSILIRRRLESLQEDMTRDLINANDRRDLLRYLHNWGKYTKENQNKIINVIRQLREQTLQRIRLQKSQLDKIEPKFESRQWHLRRDIERDELYLENLEMQIKILESFGKP